MKLKYFTWTLVHTLNQSFAFSSVVLDVPKLNSAEFYIVMNLLFSSKWLVPHTKIVHQQNHDLVCLTTKLPVLDIFLWQQKPWNRDRYAVIKKKMDTKGKLTNIFSYECNSEESYEMATMTIIFRNTMTSWAQLWKFTSRTLCTPWECGTTPTLARTTSTGGSSMAPELLGLEVSSLDWSMIMLVMMMLLMMRIKLCVLLTVL